MNVREALAASEAALAVHARFSELVIALAFFWVAQYFVSLGGFLKFLLGGLVAGVLVRVIFHGHLAVSLLDFGIACALVDTQYLIVIEICHVLSDVWIVFSFRSEKESAPYIIRSVTRGETIRLGTAPSRKCERDAAPCVVAAKWTFVVIGLLPLSRDELLCR